MPSPILQIPDAFSIGKDLSCSITDGVLAQNLDAFGHVESFRAVALDREIEVTPISRGGVPLYQTLWMGGEITIRWARVYAALTYFWAAIQSNYYDLGLLPSFTLNATVLNRDGSQDEYVFIGAVPSKPEFGDFEGTKAVNQSMKFRFQRVQMVSANAPVPGASPLSF